MNNANTWNEAVKNEKNENSMTVEKLLEFKKQIKKKDKRPAAGVICHPETLKDMENKKIEPIDVDENLPENLFTGCAIATNKAIEVGKFLPCYNRKSFLIMGQMTEKNMKNYLDYKEAKKNNEKD